VAAAVGGAAALRRGQRCKRGLGARDAIKALEARATAASTVSSTTVSAAPLAEATARPRARALSPREKEVLAWLGGRTLINVGDAQRLRLAHL
jgi:hypothetical protein